MSTIPADESPTPNPHAPEGKYRRILDAALQMFAAKGFHESKISEIARIAGVADGTIYLYFKNKDDLLISLFEYHLEAINRGLENALADAGDAADQLRTVIRYHLTVAAENPSLAQLITIELRRSQKFMRDYAKEQFTAYLAQFSRVIDHGKHTGRFRPDLSTGMMRQTLFGALDTACVTWVANPNRKAEDLEVFGGFLTDLMLRAVAPS